MVKAIATILAAAVAFPAMAGATALPTPTHSYDLNGSFADSIGGPDLAPTGGMLTATGFDFGVGNGLTTTGVIVDPAAYSIEMYFRFAAHPLPYARVIYGNGVDAGLYINNLSGTERVDYYRGGPNDGGGFSLNTLHHLVFTRDSGSMVVWLDGAVALSLSSDPSSVITTPLSFFLDNATENAPGSVDFIRTYNGVLNVGDVATLWNGGTPLGSSALLGAVPEPTVWALLVAGFGLTGAAMRRRRPIASVAA